MVWDFGLSDRGEAPPGVAAQASAFPYILFGLRKDFNYGFRCRTGTSFWARSP